MGGATNGRLDRRENSVTHTRQPPDPVLDRFLDGCRLLCEEGIIWRPTMRFVVRAFATETEPPIELVTSVRSIVFRGSDVLALMNREGGHIVPGGRREPGESLEQALRREVLEETGWAIAHPQQLGCIAFHHVDLPPPEYRAHYPRFVQVICTADAASYHSELLQPDEIDGDACFLSVDHARQLPLSAYQQAFLALALEARAGDAGDMAR